MSNDMLGSYELPKNYFEDWRSANGLDFMPTSRQQLVLDATQTALDNGLFYNSDICAFVAQELKVPKEILALGTTRVEGGDFGMDVYRARQSVEKRSEARYGLKVVSQLGLAHGARLGTLVPSDGKQLRAATFESVCEINGMITVHGRRGSRLMKLIVTGTSFVAAIERAAAQGLRKETFEQIAATVGKPHVV